MKRIAMSLPVLALALAGIGSAQTQEAPKTPAAPQTFYKMDFVIKEVEGSKVLNSRTYSMILDSGDRGGLIRAGSKVSVMNGNMSQYLDVGVNIDCGVKEVPGGLSLSLSADISSIPYDASGPGWPPVRQNRWKSEVIIPRKKPTLVFSSDDLTSKRQMQVEVTATPIP